VRVLGMDVNGRPILETARTVNISRSGLVIEGLRSRVNPGDVVSLQYKGRKVRYRVVWVGEAGSTQAGQFGLERTNLHDDLWQTDLPSLAAGRDTRTRGAERRQHRRFDASWPVEVKSPQRALTSAEVSDLSLSGCYINTLFPSPLDTVVTVMLWLGNQKLMVKGRVRTSVLGVGCGIEFVDLSAADSKRLAEYLKHNCRPAADRRKNAAGGRATQAEIVAVQTPSGRAIR
jgi:hypothetical protein